MNSKLYIECLSRVDYAKTMRALGSTLSVAVDLLEQEMHDRGLLGTDDLIQWVIKVAGSGCNYSASGEVVWVRPTRQPRRVPVYFRSFAMSLDDDEYEPPVGSVYIYQLATALQMWMPPNMSSEAIGHG